LGLQVDAPSRTLTLAPRGLLTEVDWHDFVAGPQRFGIHWAEAEAEGRTVARIRNDNAQPWTVQVGFRCPGAGGEGELARQSRVLASGEQATFTMTASVTPNMAPGMVKGEMVRREVAAFGGDEVLFRRFGPALLWGHWDGRKIWQWLGSMPLTLRFVIANASETPWHNVCVSLTSPDGWGAESRQANHWSRPNAMAAGTVSINLGDLAGLDRVTASFWIASPLPEGTPIGGASGQSPHAPTQPGEAVCLYAPGLAEPLAVTFAAELTATADNGQSIRRLLQVPVTIAPR
jgi:hypothetical protein